MAPEQWSVCRALCRALSNGRRKWRKGLDFDRRLYVVRRVFEQSSDDTYVASLSSRTIVYKGMFLVAQLRSFFVDLQDEDYESAIAHGTFAIQYEYESKLGEGTSESFYCT